jgi:hypothetical protein
MKKTLCLCLCLGLSATAFAGVAGISSQAQKTAQPVAIKTVDVNNSVPGAKPPMASTSSRMHVADASFATGQPASEDVQAKLEALAREANASWTSNSRNIDCNLAEDILLSAGAYTVAASEKQYFGYTGTGVGLEIATCLPLTTLDTDLWIYDDCTNMTQLFYRDGDSACGWATYLTSADFTFATGVNYIIAIGGYAGAGGDFEFTVMEGEPVVGPPNDNFADATPIVVNGPCESATTVGATPDCLPPLVQGACYSGFYSAASTGAAADVWYSFVADGVSLYSVSLCGSSYDSALGLFDASGAGIESNDDSCSLQSEITCVLPAGDIYVAVDGYGSSTGDFTLCVTTIDCPPLNCTGTAEVEPNDGPNGDGTVGSIVSGETICGDVFTWSETDSLGNVTNYRDTDWYELLLVTDAVVEVNLSPEEFDGIAFLIASDQATIIASADANGYCTGEALLSECLAAGSYYVVAAPNGFTGIDIPANYSLSVIQETCVFTTPCDTWSATPIALPYAGAGTNVGAGDIYGSTAGDVGFSFTLLEESVISVGTCLPGTNYDSDSYLFAGDPCNGGTELLYNDGNSTCAEIAWATGWSLDCSAPLAAGDYTLVITGYSAEEGNFTLDVTATPTAEACACPPIDCVGTPEVEPNDGPNGDGTVGTAVCSGTTCGEVFTWSETDSLGNVTNYRDTDWYELLLIGDNYVSLALDVEQFDGVLFLVASDQSTVLASADAAGFCEDELLATDCLPAGSYYVVVAPNDFTGVEVPASYGLTVGCDPCTYVSPCESAVAIDCNTTANYSSALSAGNSWDTYCNGGEDGPEVIFSFDHPGGVLVIDLASATADAQGDDLDMALLGSCDPLDCLAMPWSVGSTESINGDYPAGIYYLVVDAWTWTGLPYDFDLSLACGVVYEYVDCQAVSTIDDAWTFGTSEVDVDGAGSFYNRVDRFGGVAGAITDLSFDGLALFNDGVNWVACVEDPMPFVITFYDLSLTAVATFNADLVGVPTGNLYGGAYETLNFSYTLSSPLALAEGFIGIQGAGDPACWFLWGSSSTGVDNSSLVDDGTGFVSQAYDLNFCLSSGIVCDAPANMAIEMLAGNAVLTWDPVPGAGSYNLYASLDGYGTYTLIGNGASNTYTDVGAQAAGRRFYKIAAVCGE